MNTSISSSTSSRTSLQNHQSRYILSTGLHELKNDMYELERTKDKNDLMGMRSSLHKMLGVAQIIRKDAIINTIQHLQTAVKTEKSLKEISAWLTLLYSHIEEELDNFNGEVVDLRVLVYQEQTKRVSLLEDTAINIAEVSYCDQPKQLLSHVSKWQPDVIVLVGRHLRTKIFEEITNIRAKHVGSRICYVDAEADLRTYMNNQNFFRGPT